MEDSVGGSSHAFTCRVVYGRTPTIGSAVACGCKRAFRQLIGTTVDAKARERLLRLLCLMQSLSIAQANDQGLLVEALSAVGQRDTFLQGAMTESKLGFKILTRVDGNMHFSVVA